MYSYTNGTKDSNDPKTTNGVNGHQSTWSDPGPVAFDFRSDTITTPTQSMLNAITQTTLADDVFSEDPTTNALEALCAEMTGHEAALFVSSGTMGNQIAVRTHLGAPPHSILTDHRSHILRAEAGGVATLSAAMVEAVHARNGHHLTLEDVQEHAVIDDDVHSCPAKLISLENTLAGTIQPLEEVRRITKWAHEHDILVHMDGARLWEAVVAGAGSLKDYASAVDSVSLCFSKGLGAPIGSMLVGSKSFIKRARWIRKSIGGGTRQVGILTAAAKVALEETFLGGKLKASQENARKVGKIWEEHGGKLQYAVETNMVWLDLGAAKIETGKFVEIAAKHGLRAFGGRFVVHYQICDEAIEKFRGLAKEVLRGE